MKIQPLFDKIVIQPQKAEEKTASGIYIPDTAKQDKPQFGKVIAVGEESKIVKIGDTVVFAKYGPTELNIEGEEYLIVKEEDILAKI